MTLISTEHFNRCFLFVFSQNWFSVSYIEIVCLDVEYKTRFLNVDFLCEWIFGAIDVLKALNRNNLPDTRLNGTIRSFVLKKGTSSIHNQTIFSRQLFFLPAVFQQVILSVGLRIHRMHSLLGVKPLAAIHWTTVHIYIWIYVYIRGAYDKFPDFFRMGI